MRTGECTVGCGACCRSLRLQVPPEYSANADIRRWVELHGVRLVQQGGGTFAVIEQPCSALTEDGLCSLFGTPERPDLCSHWPATPEAMEPVADVCSYRFEEVAV